jgi:hypothetical protein
VYKRALTCRTCVFHATGTSRHTLKQLILAEVRHYGALAAQEEANSAAGSAVRAKHHQQQLQRRQIQQQQEQQLQQQQQKLYANGASPDSRLQAQQQQQPQHAGSSTPLTDGGGSCHSRSSSRSGKVPTGREHRRSGAERAAAAAAVGDSSSGRGRARTSTSRERRDSHNSDPGAADSKLTAAARRERRLLRASRNSGGSSAASNSCGTTPLGAALVSTASQDKDRDRVIDRRLARAQQYSGALQYSSAEDAAEAAAGVLAPLPARRRSEPCSAELTGVTAAAVGVQRAPIAGSSLPRWSTPNIHYAVPGTAVADSSVQQQQQQWGLAATGKRSPPLLGRINHRTGAAGSGHSSNSSTADAEASRLLSASCGALPAFQQLSVRSPRRRGSDELLAGRRLTTSNTTRLRSLSPHQQPRQQQQLLQQRPAPMQKTRSADERWSGVSGLNSDSYAWARQHRDLSASSNLNNDSNHSRKNSPGLLMRPLSLPLPQQHNSGSSAVRQRAETAVPASVPVPVAVPVAAPYSGSSSSADVQQQQLSKSYSATVSAVDSCDGVIGSVTSEQVQYWSPPAAGVSAPQHFKALVESQQQAHHGSGTASSHSSSAGGSGGGNILTRLWRHAHGLSERKAAAANAAVYTSGSDGPGSCSSSTSSTVAKKQLNSSSSSSSKPGPLKRAVSGGFALNKVHAGGPHPPALPRLPSAGTAAAAATTGGSVSLMGPRLRLRKRSSSDVDKQLLPSLEPAAIGDEAHHSSVVQQQLQQHHRHASAPDSLAAARQRGVTA